MESRMEVSSRNSRENYHMTQQYHFWVFIQKSENTNMKRETHHYVHSNVICNSQSRNNPWLSSDEWRRCIHTDTQWNRIQPQEQHLAICKMCMDLEGISLGDISQTQKDKLSYSHEKSKTQNKTKLTDTENRWMAARGRGWGMGKMGGGGSESTNFQL